MLYIIIKNIGHCLNNVIKPANSHLEIMFLSFTHEFHLLENIYSHKHFIAFFNKCWSVQLTFSNSNYKGD